MQVINYTELITCQIFEGLMARGNKYTTRLKVASNNFCYGDDACNMSKNILSDMKITKIVLPGELITCGENWHNGFCTPCA